VTSTATWTPALDPAPPRRRYPIVIAGAVALIVVAVWIVAFSPLLGVRTVTVTGTKTVTTAQVEAAAAMNSGTPLVRLDAGAVRKRVEAIPGIASASVSVSYPSTVRIRVSERVAVGYLGAAGGGSFTLVDRNGVQYEKVDTAPAGLPRFALPTGPASSVAQAAGQAVTVVAAALSPAVLAQLNQISADNPQSITLALRDGRTVVWGSDDRSRQKAALLPALLAQAGTHFDLSNLDLVVVR
jgi:cell division protein FtsQ